MSIYERIVTLRAPEIADLAQLHAWSNSNELWSQLVGWHFPYSTRSTEQWIRSRNDNDQINQVFVIETADRELVGTANLVDINWKNRGAIHGVMIGNPEARGKGYALDAVMALMRYAFDELGLERMESTVLSSNPRSLHFYTRKCGWTLEGTRRRAAFRQGGFVDLNMIGIVRDDYIAHAQRTRYWSGHAEE